MEWDFYRGNLEVMEEIFIMESLKLKVTIVSFFAITTVFSMENAPNDLPVLNENSIGSIMRTIQVDEDILLRYSQVKDVSPSAFIQLCARFFNTKEENFNFFVKVLKLGSGVSDELKINLLDLVSRQKEYINDDVKLVLFSEFINLVNHNMASYNKNYANLKYIFSRLMEIINNKQQEEIIEAVKMQFERQAKTKDKFDVFNILCQPTLENNEVVQDLLKNMIVSVLNPKTDYTFQLKTLQTLNDCFHGSELLKFAFEVKNVEEEIRRKKFNYKGSESMYEAHSSVGTENINLIVSEFLSDFHTYQKSDVDLDLNSYKEKTKELLENKNDEVFVKLRKELGEDIAEGMRTEAISNIDRFFSSFNLPANEIKTLYNGKRMTIGIVYALTWNYIENQKGKPNYDNFRAGLIQAFANSNAMKMCYDGSISSMLNVIFGNEFNKQIGRPYEGFVSAIQIQYGNVAEYIKETLETYSPKIKFDYKAPFLSKNFNDIHKNFYLRKLFGIFNRYDLNKVFGVDVQQIPGIMDAYPLPAGGQDIVTYVITLLNGPVFLALLSEYSDFVVFQPNVKGLEKMSYPDFMAEVLETAS